MDLIERQQGASVLATPETVSVIHALRTAANDVICWTNDVASVDKEAAHGELNNLVAVLRQESEAGWEEAEVLATRMVSARTREFDQIQRELLNVDPSPETAMFVAGLKHWIAGSLAWHLTSPRYGTQLAAV